MVIVPRARPALRVRVGILLVASYYRNRDELRRDGPLGLYADLTL